MEHDYRRCVSAAGCGSCAALTPAEYEEVEDNFGAAGVNGAELALARRLGLDLPTDHVDHVEH